MNRLKQVKIQDIINNTTQILNYELNALGQRIEKNNLTLNSSNLFIYDSNNQIIAEYDQNDSIIKEYIYFNGVPITFIKPKIISNSGASFTVDELFYIYSDHLGTPRKITNQDNILQWSWNNFEPFGHNEPIINSNIEFNLRFPGQYYDQETKTNYNLFRDYNANLGRYVQSDPIGLSSGLNSYAYAEQNPFKFSDELGLISSINQSFVDFWAGFGDSASFGLTYFIREFGDFNEVNMCSYAYYGGETADIMINIGSYSLSMYLRYLIKNFTPAVKKDIRKNINKLAIYKNQMKKNYDVHHINPLYGHKNISGIKSKQVATFPTGGLNIKYHTSKYNLKTLLKSEHNKVHSKMIKLEYTYEVYHHPLVTGIKIENNLLR